MEQFPNIALQVAITRCLLFTLLIIDNWVGRTWQWLVGFGSLGGNEERGGLWNSQNLHKK